MSTPRMLKNTYKSTRFSACCLHKYKIEGQHIIWGWHTSTKKVTILRHANTPSVFVYKSYRSCLRPGSERGLCKRIVPFRRRSPSLILQVFCGNGRTEEFLYRKKFQTDQKGYSKRAKMEPKGNQKGYKVIQWNFKNTSCGAGSRVSILAPRSYKKRDRVFYQNF